MKYRVCVLFAGLALAVPGLACADDGWRGNAALPVPGGNGALTTLP